MSLISASHSNFTGDWYDSFQSYGLRLRGGIINTLEFALEGYYRSNYAMQGNTYFSGGLTWKILDQQLILGAELFQYDTIIFSAVWGENYLDQKLRISSGIYAVYIIDIMLGGYEIIEVSYKINDRILIGIGAIYKSFKFFMNYRFLGPFSLVLDAAMEINDPEYNYLKISLDYNVKL